MNNPPLPFDKLRASARQGMLEFLNLKPEAFGIDISDLSIKIIKLKKKRGRLSLSSFGEVVIGNGIVDDGEIKDEESLAREAKNCLAGVRGEKIETRRAIASLPEEKSFLQVIQMPKMEKEDLAGAIRFEVENYIPVPTDEVYLDFQVLSSSDSKKSNIFLAAMPKKVVDSYLSVLKKAGIKPVALEIESQAIARALIKDNDALAKVLIIDIGFSRTSFIIFSGKTVRFTSSIPISSQTFDRAIAKGTEINLEEAKRIKEENGLRKKDNIKIKKGGEKRMTRREVFESMVPVLTDLAEQIGKCLDYYYGHSRDAVSLPEERKIERIILCGGGAGLLGLDNFLSGQLGMPVEIGNPWINAPALAIQARELGMQKEEYIKYTTAIGLALRGVSNNE